MNKDREQKIAEIREALSQSIKFEEMDHFKEKPHIQAAKAHSNITKDRHDIIEFLLNELDILKDRLESANNENKRLREQRDKQIQYKLSAIDRSEQVGRELEAAQQEIERLKERYTVKAIDIVHEENTKLIEGLRDIMALNYVYANKTPSEFARDILREIGVTVE